MVDDADRRRIDDKSERPALKDRAWHTARLVRTASTGRLEVFVDGETTPIMTATDRAIPSGRLGVGSFDDAGAFRGIRVQGTARGALIGASIRRSIPPEARPVFRYTTGLR